MYIDQRKQTSSQTVLLLFRSSCTTMQSTRSPTSPRTSRTTGPSATSVGRRATTASWPSRRRSRSVMGLVCVCLCVRVCVWACVCWSSFLQRDLMLPSRPGFPADLAASSRSRMDFPQRVDEALSVRASCSSGESIVSGPQPQPAGRGPTLQPQGGSAHRSQAPHCWGSTRQ